jgi:hypothetical protein
VLRRIASAFVLAVTMAACSSASPSATHGPPAQPVIAASWVADDRSVVALNVVLPRSIEPGGLPALAEHYRREHPDARVIVRFFAGTAGEERFVVGYVPTDGRPLPGTSASDAVLATFDFPAPASSPTDDVR